MLVIYIPEEGEVFMRGHRELNYDEEEYEVIHEHYCEIVRYTYASSWNGYKALYMNEKTGEVFVSIRVDAPYKKSVDHRNRVVTIRHYDGKSKGIIEALERELTIKAEEHGIVIGSVHQKHEVENARYYLIPKTMDDLMLTLMRFVESKTNGTLYHERQRAYLTDIYEYISHMDKRTFQKIKQITGPYTDFVLTVNRPKFRREVGNKDTKTFDFIDVEMVVRSTDATKEKVKANKDEIFKKAIEKLENNKSFQKYGVPINFLKMYQFVVRKDGTLILSFCMKGEQ